MKYDVALSFAGEDRKYVEEVAKELKRLGARVFYDDFETVDLWGKDLYAHLQKIYQNEAEYTIIFISEHYAKKAWTNHERKMAQARAFTENREYILPARFDDTEIEGLTRTVGYIDLRKLSAQEFARLIIQKIRPTAGNLPGQAPAPGAAQATAQQNSKISEQKTAVKPVTLKPEIQSRSKSRSRLKPFFTIIAVLIGFLLSIIVVGSLFRTPPNYFQLGLDCEQKEDLDCAISNYDNEIQLRPDAGVYYNRGNVYLKKGDFKKAINDFNRAVKLNPSLNVIYGNRGIAYRENGDYDLAIKDFNKLIESDPKDILAYINRGEAYVKKDDFASAINDFDKVINELDPKNSIAYCSRGIVYFLNGDYDQALADYTKAIELNPDDESAFRHRALIYDRKGEKAKAVADRKDADIIKMMNGIRNS